MLMESSIHFSALRIAIVLIGFGHVGRRFAHLLQELKPALEARGIEPAVVGIATRRHGGVFDKAGLDTVHMARRVAGGDLVGPVSHSPTAQDLVTQLCSRDGSAVPGSEDDTTPPGSLGAEARVVVETTPLDVQSGEPAVSHIRAALAAGAHVITANKGPVAHAYHDLMAESRAAGVRFLFEGAMMDGIPIFNLVRETMPGVTIRGFRGVVNSTTNHILTAMEQGEAFDAALARMQAQGIAEADASLDVDGWDSAAKVAAMANVWMDARISPQDVQRKGISAADAARTTKAVSEGRRVKLVGRASRTDSGVRASVQLETLEVSDPLGGLDGQANALEIATDVLGRVVITQRDGGLEKTAYALFTDLLTIARTARTSEAGVEDFR